LPETSSTRLVQIIHPQFRRRVALVHDDELHLLSTYRSVYAFAMAAIETGSKLRELLSTDLSGIVLDYNEVYALKSAWQFLPSFDHPEHPARCLVSGCANGPANASSRPAAPAWFVKGNGMHLRGHGEDLIIPSFALSGAEEAELAAVYVIDPNGAPRRVGLTPGNEFADPAMAKEDPRMLAHSKLRTCAIGPELTLDAEFAGVRGSVAIERGGAPVWSKEIATGEANAVFALADVERHLFKYDAHLIPGDAHVHYLGGSVSSFGEGIRLEDGDEALIQWEGFGRPLRNLIRRGAEAGLDAANPL
jgi:hypothetical protein